MTKRDLIIKVLTATKGNRRDAARILGIAHSSMRAYISRYGLTDQFRVGQGNKPHRMTAALERLAQYEKEKQA